ncbi:enoyl-CoA hydratase/isomerase family protein, partial [Streptomyces sp. ME18-1-4]|uniref:enoyl-CoA hydratase/isomerase family protein n=1 Tax=Streptomyces sp. ME18-1-4 TaxID=3028685 RepID=UPI0029AE5C37
MVELELEDGLAVVTIDRPHARNAIDPHTMGELEKALEAAEGARALAVTGSGEKAFVSGGDLKELARLRTEGEASDMALRMRALCDRIAAFPGPVVAALNGHALGGGAEVGGPSRRLGPASAPPRRGRRHRSVADRRAPGAQLYPQPSPNPGLLSVMASTDCHQEAHHGHATC